MCRISVLCLIVTPILGFTAENEYQSKEGHFEVTFPDTPERVEKDLSTTPGGRVMHLVTIRSGGPGRTIFSVTYTDYPKNVRKVLPSVVLNSTIEAMTGTDGKAIDKSETTLKVGSRSIPGRKATIKAGHTLVIANVFLDGDRLYEVMVTGRQEDMDDKVNGLFFSSFVIPK